MCIKRVSSLVSTPRVAAALARTVQVPTSTRRSTQQRTATGAWTTSKVCCTLVLPSATQEHRPVCHFAHHFCCPITARVRPDDNCGGSEWPAVNTSWIKFRQGFDECTKKTGRDMILSVEYCNPGNECMDWVADVANLWRTTADVQASWSSVMANIHAQESMYPIAGHGKAAFNGACRPTPVLAHRLVHHVRCRWACFLFVCRPGHAPNWQRWAQRDGTVLPHGSIFPSLVIVSVRVVTLNFGALWWCRLYGALLELLCWPARTFCTRRSRLWTFCPILKLQL